MSIIGETVEELLGSKVAKLLYVIVLLVLIYIAAAISFSIWPFSVARGLAHKVVNEDAIIQNYEWFYDQHNAIKAQAANVKVIKAMPTSEKQQTELAGTKMVLNNMVAEYNSRSKQINRNMWKANDLPYQLNHEELISDTPVDGTDVIPVHQKEEAIK